jgi:hypothetical protein
MNRKPRPLNRGYASEARVGLATSNFVELRHGEVRRIQLPRTRVNKGRKGILRTSASVLALVASGTSETASFGKEDTQMYWYNPTTRSSEKVAAPSNDSQAIQMLAGTQDSAEFVKEYCQLRRSGTPIEQGLVLVGHEFRLRQPEYQLVLR